MFGIFKTTDSLGVFGQRVFFTSLFEHLNHIHLNAEGWGARDKLSVSQVWSAGRVFDVAVYTIILIISYKNHWYNCPKCEKKSQTTHIG